MNEYVKRTWPGTGKITPLYLCYPVVGWSLSPSSGQEQARTAGWGWGIYWRRNPWGGALKNKKNSYIILLYMSHYLGHECTNSSWEICWPMSWIYLPFFILHFEELMLIFRKKYQFTRYRSLESFIKFICLGLREEARRVLHCGILSICVTQGYWPTYLCLGPGEEGGFLHCGVLSICVTQGYWPTF